MEVEQKEDRHDAPELPNPRPEQIPITMEVPVDTGLIGKIVTRTNSISPTSLLDETVELHHNNNHSHLNFQIFQIIAPKN